MSAGFDFKKRLGSGNFGEVWYVIDTGLQCERAVKMIPPDKVINQKNFFQEAQVLKAAEHPNIVTVYETGEMDDGRIYVAMEYLENGSLDDEVSGAYLKLSRAKRIMIDILRGLSYAHSKKIVHRDIKPANIMIGNGGEGKLSDFGLALPDIKKMDLSAIKQYQYLIHLAPEVKKFSDYTYQADIYACGMTLYRLVNGDSYIPSMPPHRMRALVRKGEFPDRKKYRGFVSRSFRNVINKAIKPKPEDRFKTADEMRHALERVNVSIDWDEWKLPSGKRWDGLKDDFYIRIERVPQKDGKWEVIFRKGRDQKKLRRDNRFCKRDMTLKQAKSYSYKVLQKVVNK